VNGHVYPEVDGKLRETFRQPLQLFRNLGGGKFREIPGTSGLQAIPPQSARGASFADFDNDGDVDAVVSVMDGPPLLLENRDGNRSNWLRLALTGTKANRMGIGVKVKVIAGSSTQFSTAMAGGSYLSSNDPRLHFGLGSAAEASVEITWPGGTTQRISPVKANSQIDVMEPR
jgi:hypothetical protein